MDILTIVAFGAVAVCLVVLTISTLQLDRRQEQLLKLYELHKELITELQGFSANDARVLNSHADALARIIELSGGKVVRHAVGTKAADA